MLFIAGGTPKKKSADHTKVRESNMNIIVVRNNCRQIRNAGFFAAEKMVSKYLCININTSHPSIKTTVD
jgi:hypothetical protein